MANGIEASEEVSLNNNPEKDASELVPSAEDDAASDNTSETTSNASYAEAVERTIDTRRNLITKL